jgi:hypothetical protein
MKHAVSNLLLSMSIFHLLSEFFSLVCIDKSVYPDLDMDNQERCRHLFKFLDFSVKILETPRT